MLSLLNGVNMYDGNFKYFSHNDNSPVLDFDETFYHLLSFIIFYYPSKLHNKLTKGCHSLMTTISKGSISKYQHTDSETSK